MVGKPVVIVVRGEGLGLRSLGAGGGSSVLFALGWSRRRFLRVGVGCWSRSGGVHGRRRERGCILRVSGGPSHHMAVCQGEHENGSTYDYKPGSSGWGHTLFSSSEISFHLRPISLAISV